MAENSAPKAKTDDANGPFMEFSLGVMFATRKRFAVVSELAAWLENCDRVSDDLPTALVLACEDLSRELDRLEDQVCDRMRELEDLREGKRAMPEGSQ